MCGINVDGAVSSKKGCPAVGVVIRKGLGESVVARAMLVPGVKSPLAMELMAIKVALLWCNCTGITKGEIRIDSKKRCTSGLVQCGVSWSRIFSVRRCQIFVAV